MKKYNLRIVEIPRFEEPVVYRIEVYDDRLGFWVSTNLMCLPDLSGPFDSADEAEKKINDWIEHKQSTIKEVKTFSFTI